MFENHVMKIEVFCEGTVILLPYFNNKNDKEESLWYLNLGDLLIKTDE